MTLATDVQKPNPGDLVTLFELDATSVGGVVNRFTASTNSASPITWRGNIYTPINCEAEGFEWNGRGALPTPRLRISNVTLAMSALLLSGDDLLGCPVTRYRTFRQHLADGIEVFEADVYRVERKAGHNKLRVELELAAVHDQEGAVLPGRQIIANRCMWQYRRFDQTTGDFDYSRATCPYAGELMFNRLGQVVTSKAADVCGKRITDCKRRFGQTAVLPFGGFPGVARVR